MKTLLKVLGRSISHHRFLYILCLLLGGISELLVLVQPQLGGKLIEGVQSGQLSGSIVAALVFILASNALVTMCQQLVLGKICEDSAYELRCGLVERFSVCGSVEPGSSTVAVWGCGDETGIACL